MAQINIYLSNSYLRSNHCQATTLLLWTPITMATPVVNLVPMETHLTIRVIVQLQKLPLQFGINCTPNIRKFVYCT